MNNDKSSKNYSSIRHGKVIDPYGALKGATIHCLDDRTVNPPMPPVIIVETPVYFTVNHGYYYVAPGSREAVFEKPESRKASKVVIPSQIYADGRICKVTGIRSNAFKGCGKVKTIVIGKNVRTIQKNAFKGASHVKKITIKSKNLKLRNIGKNAFAGLGKKVKTVRVKLPGKMKKTYTKILRKRGLKNKRTRKVIYQ